MTVSQEQDFYKNKNVDFPTFKIEQTVLDTTAKPFIQNGSYRLFTAYDPSIAWFRGRYWVAFECWGPDFLKISPYAKASACIGPLDKDHNIITQEVRVLIMGGKDRMDIDNSIPSYSASAPKLLTFEGKMYVFWSSVKISNLPDENLRLRLNNLTANNLTNLSPTLASQFITLRSRAGAQGDILSNAFLKYEDYILNPFNDVTDFRAETNPKLAFYTWQSSVLNAGEHPKKWTPSAEGITYSLPAAVKFESVESYGSEIKFIETADKPFPALLQSTTENNFLMGAWQFSKFSKVLPTTTKSSESRVADINDVKIMNGRIYFTAAIGGHPSSNPSNFCTTPTSGESDDGCYRLEIFSSASPLVNLRVNGKSENIDIRYYYEWNRYGLLPEEWEAYEKEAPKARHEYSRFIKLPDGIKIIAHFLNVRYEGAREIIEAYFSLIDVNPNSPDLSNLTLSTNELKTNTLTQPSSLNAKQGLLSDSKVFSLEVHNSGFDVWSTESGRKIYGIRTAAGGKPRLTLQSDGHLVFYPNHPSRTGFWATHNYAKSALSKVILTNSGNIEHFENSGAPIWKSKFVRKQLVNGEFLIPGEILISENNEFYLEVRNNGFAIRTVREGKTTFEIKTSVGSLPRLILQADGHLVYYPTAGSKTDLWATYKLGSKTNSIIRISNTGRLEHIEAGGNSVWQSQ